MQGWWSVLKGLCYISICALTAMGAGGHPPLLEDKPLQFVAYARHGGLAAAVAAGARQSMLCCANCPKESKWAGTCLDIVSGGVACDGDVEATTILQGGNSLLVRGD